MKLIIDKSNNIGAIASAVCLVHCIITPFLFVAKLCTDSCCEAAPGWWSFLDYVFLFVALFAVYQSSRVTTKKGIGIGLWISWGALFLVIINESLQVFPLFENAIYVPTLSLIFLHLYNRKYCKCEANCCTNEEDVKSL